MTPPASAAPDVTVLLLNYRGWRDTIACLESVFRLDYPSLHVVVCDNASPDESVAEIVAWAEGRRVADLPGAGFPVALEPVAKPIPHAVLERDEAEQGAQARADAPLTIVRTGANGGFAAGNNVGLRHVIATGRSQYVWLLNNDTITAPDALRHLVAEAERDSGIGVVGGTMLEFHAPETVQVLAGGEVAFWGSLASVPGAGNARNAPRPAPPMDFVTGGCLLARVDAIRAAGLLDERFFMYGEDADWSRRIVAAGYRLAFAPRAEVWHKGGGTAGHGSVLHDYHSVRSSLLYVQKHRPRMLVLATAYCAYRCLLPKLVRGQWTRGRAVARAMRESIAAPRSTREAAPHAPHAPRRVGETGRYLVNNPLWVGYLRAADATLAMLPGRARPAPAAPAPQRILLCIGGHLGDAVIATSAIALVRSTFPDAHIGVLAPTWTRQVLEGHPDVDRLHHVDHWKLDRSARPLPSRMMRHRRTVRAAVRELAEAGYEIAVDLYPFYPNAAPVLWRAHIPVRAGWASGGYGPLFTHPLEWMPTGEHVTEQHAWLLRSVLPGAMQRKVPGYRLPQPRDHDIEAARAVLREHGAAAAEYYVIHPGAGSPLKTWPRASWTGLLRALAATGKSIVVTGAGDAEAAFAGELAREVPGIANVVGQLPWGGLVDVVRGAEAVIAVDTAVAHVAAAVGTPGVTLMTGPNDPRHWRPLSPVSGVLTTAPAPTPTSVQAVASGPAPQPLDGAIEYLREIEVRHVLAALDRVTAAATRDRREPVGHALR